MVTDEKEDSISLQIARKGRKWRPAVEKMNTIISLKVPVEIFTC